MEIVHSPEFIRGLSRLGSQHKGCVATIGSFDGVHVGHRALLQNIVKLAKESSLPSLVIVFEPQPNEYFSRERVPARLMRLREKVCALFEAGIDRVLCVRFNESFRSLTAMEFIQRVLVDGIDVKHLIIGDDFRFGCDRTGDFKLLQSCGEQLGFSVADTHTQTAVGERISSTRIRQLLEVDKLQDAAQLLGRDYSICGRVVYGKQMGRTLGVPTANIGLGRYRSPVQGVYAVTMEILNSDLSDTGVNKTIYPAVANVGVKPTVEGGKKPLLEVHAIDVAQLKLDLYGKFVKVYFKKKIRQEKQFSSLAELQSQILMDIEHAKHYFENHTTKLI